MWHLFIIIIDAFVPPHPHPLFMALSSGILQSVTPGNFGVGGIVKDCVINLCKTYFHASPGIA